MLRELTDSLLLSNLQVNNILHFSNYFKGGSCTFPVKGPGTSKRVSNKRGVTTQSFSLRSERAEKSR